MQPEQLIENMSEALYLRLREAVETGRWPDGNPLTEQQREDSLSLVMMYQARHLDQTEPFSIGKNGQFISKSKAEMRREREQEITRFSIQPETPESDKT
ncbi:YeaC family protein [Aliidiomarina soli]|uniref:DUF1315 domain-containing protein n=1 Tax=Aliidiomarina soli TaxID=1928574 RepID=A0A432WM94_9GAMM|nr:DUF1315 family protein [Aliidiomarina soli]RUO34936.1 DUF1315 domain-containing protein [Aliidiomarina soli]